LILQEPTVQCNTHVPKKPELDLIRALSYLMPFMPNSIKH